MVPGSPATLGAARHCPTLATDGVRRSATALLDRGACASLPLPGSPSRDRDVGQRVARGSSVDDEGTRRGLRAPPSALPAASSHLDPRSESGRSPSSGSWPAGPRMHRRSAGRSQASVESISCVDGWLVIECDSKEFHEGWDAQQTGSRSRPRSRVPGFRGSASLGRGDHVAARTCSCRRSEDSWPLAAEHRGATSTPRPEPPIRRRSREVPGCSRRRSHEGTALDRRRTRPAPPEDPQEAYARRSSPTRS